MIDLLHMIVCVVCLASVAVEEIQLLVVAADFAIDKNWLDVIELALEERVDAFCWLTQLAVDRLRYDGVAVEYHIVVLCIAREALVDLARMARRSFARND